MNFSENNEGIWFLFDQTDPTQGRVKIRPCPPGETKKIQKLTVKTKTKFKHGQKYDVEEVNQKMSDRLYYDYCIEEWENVIFGGQELECNAENKVKLINDNYSFAAFVVNCLESLTDNPDNLNIEENLAKN